MKKTEIREAVAYPNGAFDFDQMGSRRYTPPPAVCSFCGAELAYERMEAEDGTFLCWNSEPQRCTCPEAQSWWAERIRRERAAVEKEAARKTAALHRELLENALGQSGLPPAHYPCTFSAFRPYTAELSENLATCKGYADSFRDRLRAGEGLLIRGSVGVGKTHLASAIALRIMDQALGTVVWRGDSQVRTDFRAAMNDNRRTEKDVLTAYTTCDLLILDDFGKERLTPWSAGVMFSVINGRFERGLPTIITTNLTDRQIAVNFSAAEKDNTGGWTASAVVSRLSDRRRFLRVVVRGKDYRLQSRPADWQASAAL